MTPSREAVEDAARATRRGVCNKCGYAGIVDVAGAHAGCAYLAAFTDVMSWDDLSAFEQKVYIEEATSIE